MAFEGSTEREIAVRLMMRADQLRRMLDAQCPQVILDEQRHMIREAALALPPGAHIGGDDPSCGSR